MSDLYRTRTMDQISEDDIGKELKIAGWVENIRDHGGVSFIDLRDMYGVMQVVLRDTTLLNHVRKEECLSIEGLVEHRDEETFNPKIPTGTIELEAHKIDILGKIYRDLPFEIATSKEIREDVRLKYRYLDMRNRKVKDNILFRSKVIRFLRDKMEELGFLLRVQGIMWFRPGNIKENFTRFRRRRSSINSCSWLAESINIIRLHHVSEMKMPVQTDLRESSIS